jgi:hypothetical protein
LYQKINTAHALVGASFLIIESMLIVMHGMPPEMCEPPSYEPFEIEADMWLVGEKAAGDMHPDDVALHQPQPSL